MRRTICTLLALFTILVVSCAGPVAPEQAEAKWRQDTVTALARDLVGVAGDLRDSVRREPTSVPVGVRRARLQALDDLRVAQGSIRSLARQLEGGAGRVETYPTFRRIQILRRDVARNARRAMLTEPTLSKLEAARELLLKLEPFYAAEATAYEAEIDS